MLYLLSCLFLLRVQDLVDASSSWDYLERDSHGNLVSSLYKWSHIPNSMCNGSAQSPIDIDTTSTEYNNYLGAFTYSTNCQNQDQIDFSIEKDGHKVLLNPTNECTFEFKFGDVGKFELVHIHFHWGSSDDVGSEHTLDQKPFPLEVHFVSYDANQYQNFNQAKNSVDGLAVLGVFVKVKDSESEVFEQITQTFENPQFQESVPDYRVNVRVNFSQLLPFETKASIENYYRYKGSLTTPPCTQNVLWTVFPRPISISQTQMARFRKLKYSNNLGPMMNNYRPVQKLNGEYGAYMHNRVVSRSFSVAASSMMRTTQLPILLSAFIVVVSYGIKI